MNNNLKKKHARAAASKFPCDPASAVKEYAFLTRQTATNRVDDLKQEMLDLLPGYRHPANDEFAEKIIFEGVVDAEFDTVAFSDPPWFVALQRLPTVSQEQIDEIRMDLVATERRLAIADEKVKELEPYRTAILKAREIAKPKFPGEHIKNRTSEIVMAIGLPCRPGAPTKDHSAAYCQYVYLVRHKGYSRDKAAYEIHQQYGYKSVNAAQRALYEARKEVKNFWKNYNPHLYENYVTWRLKSITPWS